MLLMNVDARDGPGLTLRRFADIWPVWLALDREALTEE